MTPRMVAASPFTITDFPTIPGSDAYRVVQTSWPRTRVRGAPGSSSPGRKPVPITGRIRRTSNTFAETRAPWNRSGPSRPARFTVLPEKCPSISKLCCWARQS